MECQQITNNKMCTCTYTCQNHGVCCACLHYHRKNNELPACYFTKEQEKTYDRSLEYYNKLKK